MLPRLRQFVDSLVYRFGGAARGAGLPVPEHALDEEYRSGKWDHFFSAAELPRNELLVRKIHSAHPAPRILDIGCGSGRLASLLEPPRVSDYLGLDLSREGLRRAKSLRLPFARFEHGNFEAWRTTELWDIIVFNETLGYARDPAKLVACFADALTPGGRIFVSYFRSGNYLPLWERLGQRFQTHSAEVAQSSAGMWDIRELALRR